jgi:hypothetical protein
MRFRKVDASLTFASLQDKNCSCRILRALYEGGADGVESHTSCVERGMHTGHVWLLKVQLCVIGLSWRLRGDNDDRPAARQEH